VSPLSVTLAAGQQTATAQVTGVGPGGTQLTATAPGFTSGAHAVTVTLPPPTVTSFTPTSGRVGDSVTITCPYRKFHPRCNSLHFG
jgi:hypothetical protein